MQGLGVHEAVDFGQFAEKEYGTEHILDQFLEIAKALIRQID